MRKNLCVAVFLSFVGLLARPNIVTGQGEQVVSTKIIHCSLFGGTGTTTAAHFIETLGGGTYEVYYPGLTQVLPGVWTVPVDPMALLPRSSAAEAESPCYKGIKSSTKVYAVFSVRPWPLGADPNSPMTTSMAWVWSVEVQPVTVSRRR